MKSCMRAMVFSVSIAVFVMMLAHEIAAKHITVDEASSFSSTTGATETVRNSNSDPGILIMYEDSDTKGNPFWGYGFCFNTSLCWAPADTSDIRYWDSLNRTQTEWESFVGQVQKLATDADNFHLSLHYSLIRLEWYHQVALKKDGIEYAVEPAEFWKKSNAEEFIQKAVAKLPHAPVRWGKPYGPE